MHLQSIVLIAGLLFAPLAVCAQAVPGVQVQFSPPGWSPPGNPVTLVASIFNDGDVDLTDASLDLVIFTGSQYKPSLVSAGGGFTCTGVNTGRYSTPHEVCIGGVVPAGDVVDVVYTIPTPAAPMYTLSLRYGATARLDPYGISESDSILIADFNASDLVVNGTVTPGAAVIGTPLIYQVNIVNIGFVPSLANTMRVTFPNGASQNVDVPALAVSEQISYSTSYVPTVAGTATTTFTVDPNNLLAEGREYNNTIGLSASISGALPDLIVAQSQPASAPVNGTYSKTVTVSNIGNANATNITVRDLFFISDAQSFTTDHGFSCARSTYRVPRTNRYLPNGFQCSGGVLAAGETATITAVIKASWYATTTTNNLSVDPSNAIVEGNETNNSATGSLLVQ